MDGPPIAIGLEFQLDFPPRPEGRDRQRARFGRVDPGAVRQEVAVGPEAELGFDGDRPGLDRNRPAPDSNFERSVGILRAVGPMIGGRSGRDLEEAASTVLMPSKPRSRSSRMARASTGTAVVTTTTVMELWEGVHLAEASAAEQTRVRALLDGVRQTRFDTEAAIRAGKLGPSLELARKPIEVEEVMFAAIAFTLDETVLTGNPLHFRRIGGVDRRSVLTGRHELATKSRTQDGSVSGPRGGRPPTGR